MKLQGRVILVKILATAAVSAFVYASAVTLRTALFGMDGGLFALALFLLFMLLGHLAGWLFWENAPVFASWAADSKFARFLSFMLYIKDGGRFTSALTGWSIILLPLLVSFLIYRQYGIWRIIFEMLLAMIAYIISVKHSRLASTDIMNNVAVYAGFILLAACLEASNFFNNLAYLRPWLFVVSYLFILAYLIIRNQEDIDSNIFNKKHVEKSILPKNLRRFNTLSVCVVFLVIILFFNLKPIVIYLLQILGNLTIFIINGVLWILNQLFPSQGTVQQGGAPAQNFNFFGNGIETIYPIKNLLFNITKYFTILYLLYRFLLLLAKKLPGLMRKVIEFIKKLLSIKKSEEAFEAMDYSDETETLKPAHEHDSQRKLKKEMRKNWRDLRSITDPVERVRYMYYSFLNMLPLIGIRPDSCDTTMEILTKTASSGEVSKELSPFTAIYNQVRYGEKVPDTGMLSEAEGHYDRAVEVIRKK